MPQPPSYMTPFSRIDYKDISIDFLKQKGKLGYTFQYEGRNYGNKVEVDKKSEKALVEATVALFINAINSYEELQKIEDTKTIFKTSDSEFHERQK